MSPLAQLAPLTAVRSPGFLPRAEVALELSLWAALLVKGAFFRVVGLALSLWSLAVVRGMIGSLGIVERMIGIDINLLADVLLDGSEQADVLDGTKADCIAMSFRAGGATNAVNIAVCLFRQVKVDHEGNGAHINPAGSDISGDQDRQFAGTETVQGPLSGTLRLVSVNGIAAQTMLVELFGELFSTVLGAAKDDGGMISLSIQLSTQIGLKQGDFIILSQEANLLLDILNNRFIRCDRYTNWIDDEFPGDFIYLPGHGGGKEGSLVLIRKMTDDPADIRHEAHIEHPVDFIQNQPLDFAQVYMSLVDQIQQSPGSGDENIDALGQVSRLWALADATVDKAMAQTHVLAIGRKTLPDLYRELTGWCEDKGASPAASESLGILGDVMQDWERKGCRFTSSCLGATNQVATFQLWRDGAFLNGSRNAVILFAQCALNGLCKTQVLK